MYKNLTYQRFLGITILFTTFAFTVSAQKGIVSGRISSSDGKPAGSVSVHLKGKPQATLTSVNGFYKLEHIPEGEVTIQVSSIGLKNQEKIVTVQANQTATVNFILAENAEQLKEIVITGNKQNKFARKSSEYVAKMPLKNLENPQVYNSVSKELMTDQLVYTVDDAMRNATGVQKMWEPSGRAGDGGSFYSSRGFTTQCTYRNGVFGSVTSTIDGINLETVEILKGPSATLYGSSQGGYGAIINRVTKKPFDHFAGEINIAGGTDNFKRISLDLNTPINKDKKFMFRINSSYNYQNGFQENIFARNIVVDPSVLYKPNDRLSIQLDAELNYGRNVISPTIFFYFPVSVLGVDRADETSLDYQNSYTGKGLYTDSRSMNYFGQINYKLSEHFTSATILTYSSTFSNGFGSYFYLVPDSLVTGNVADADKSNYLVRADQSTKNAKGHTLQLQENVNGDFNIGNLRNRMVVGLDFRRVSPNINFYGIDPFDVVPTQAHDYDYSGYNRDALLAIYANNSQTAPYIANVKTNTYSAYVSDMLNITEQLFALAALRVDHFDNKGGTNYAPVESYTQTALSPKFGLVYQPMKDQVSLFASYQNGFTNLGYFQAYDEQATNPDFPVKTTLAKPEQANQWEGGVKLNLFAGKLTSTISYYDIHVKNTLRADSRNPALAQLQDANKVSRGLEVELIGNLFTGFNAAAGFSYNHNNYENTNADVDGRRDIYSMAPISVNLWLSYRLPENLVKGLGFGFGGNYASDNKIMNSVSYGVFTLPAYTIMNASAFYDMKKFRLGIKMDNLTNKKYWIGYGTMNPQRLRNFAANIAYKF
ncbi:iron complex outermembrane recepter protein [bacterium A37T11]|nr:iron complex outermembrane recepter protein [bacterium A37T11]